MWLWNYSYCAGLTLRSLQSPDSMIYETEQSDTAVPTGAIITSATIRNLRCLHVLCASQLVATHSNSITMTTPGMKRMYRR